MTWKTRLRDVVSLDLRSLALFRVAVAACLLLDLYIRAQALSAHYTADGVLPATDEFGSEWHVSIHLWNDSAWFQATLFAIAAGFAVMLLVGWRTRLATVASWFLLISLHSRNPILLTGGDTLLRAVLFWAMFLPLGARYSVDAALAREPLREQPRIASVATFALIAQVCMVYIFTVMLKYHRAWWVDFDAVYYALHYDAYTSHLGVWLRQVEWVLPVFTIATIAWELVGPYLVLSPWRNGPLRTFGVFGFVALHVGFALCLNIGIFSPVACAAWLALLPGWFWERVLPRLATEARRGVRIYYDGECGVCRRIVALIRTFWLVPETRVGPADDDPDMAEDLAANQSWIVVDGATGTRHRRFDGIVLLARRSPVAWPLWPVLALPPVRWLGNAAYRFTARHRRRVLSPIANLPPEQQRYGLPRVVSAVLVLVLLYVIAWNVRTTNFKLFAKVFPPSANAPLHVLRLEQKWNLFAPRPATQDGWFLAPGHLAGGLDVDVLRFGLPVTPVKPHLVNNLYPTYRWRKLMVNLYKNSYARYRAGFLRYLCRTWNAEHSGDRALTEVMLVYMREDTKKDHIAAPRPVVLSSLRCEGFERTDLRSLSPAPAANR